MRVSTLLLAFLAIFASIYDARGAKTCGSASQMKRRLTSYPARRSGKAFYGAKSASTDVTIYLQVDHTAYVFVNGHPQEPLYTCKDTLQFGMSLSKGDLIAVQARSENNGYGFYMTVMSANGDKVYMTTGQDGWKAVPDSEAGADWNLPGYDDSSWPAAVPADFQCFSGTYLNLIFPETGAVAIWAEGVKFTTIDARYVVGGRGPDCSCTSTTPGCPEDGICKNCLLIEGDGVRDCYSGWTEDQCQGDAGEYVWCG